MRGKTRIVAAFCLSIFILLFVGIYAYYATSQYKNSSDWVAHTQKTIADIQTIQLSIEDIETGQRGYVITGQEKYLEPYQNSLQRIETAHRNLRKLVADNPRQVKRLDKVYSSIQEKIAFAKSVVLARKENGFESAQKQVLTGIGENLMNDIRVQVKTFVASERVLLSQRLSLAETDFSFALNIIIASIVLAITIVLITLYFFLKDFNRRREYQKKIRESEQRVKNFLESMPLGIFVLDSQANPFYINSRAYQLLGKNFSDRLQSDFVTYVAGTNDVYPQEKQPILRALQGEQNAFADDLEIINLDGKRIPLRVNAYNVKNSEGKIEYAVSVFEDITDVREAEQKLVEARKLAEQAVVLKEAFLANMSHEIRTPMNAIIGFTDLLLKRELGAQEKDYVRTIKTSGENLLRIINDILDVSKMESGMMTFEKHPLSISEIFSSLNAMLQPKVSEKKIELSFTSDPHLPPVLEGDPTRLTQILLNLVGNAIKFTKQGSIQVKTEIVVASGNIYTVKFSVKDTGIGIPPDKLEHIFERFTQAESHTTRHYGGTGLGLSIAQQLVVLQGGKIQVASTPNVGSEFSFTLPFTATNQTTSKPKTIDYTSQLNELSSKKILLVEDNPINVKFMESLFAEYNIKPDHAANGKIAVEKVSSSAYDVVLMDIEMPEMNGYEATEFIRKTLKSEVPIIAMTAHAMAGEKEKCLQLGMNGYLSKPIRENLLFEKMFNLVLPQNPTEATTGNEQLTNLDFLVKSMRGKKPVILQTIDIFLEQLPEEITELNEAVTARDFTAIKRCAHRMKSTVSLMGISQVEKNLQEMENLAAAQQDMPGIDQLYFLVHSLSQQAIAEITVKKNNFT